MVVEVESAAGFVISSTGGTAEAVELADVLGLLKRDDDEDLVDLGLLDNDSPVSFVIFGLLRGGPSASLLASSHPREDLLFFVNGIVFFWFSGRLALLLPSSDSFPSSSAEREGDGRLGVCCLFACGVIGRTEEEGTGDVSTGPASLALCSRTRRKVVIFSLLRQNYLRSNNTTMYYFDSELSKNPRFFKKPTLKRGKLVPNFAELNVCEPSSVSKLNWKEVVTI
jgi:hypothetical protein